MMTGYGTADISKWMDEIVNHMMRFEAKTESNVEQLTNLVNNLSKVMWVREPEKPAETHTPEGS